MRCFTAWLGSAGDLRGEGIAMSANHPSALAAASFFSVRADLGEVARNAHALALAALDERRAVLRDFAEFGVEISRGEQQPTIHRASLDRGSWELVPERPGDREAALVLCHWAQGAAGGALRPGELPPGAEYHPGRDLCGLLVLPPGPVAILAGPIWSEVRADAHLRWEPPHLQSWIQPWGG